MESDCLICFNGNLYTNIHREKKVTYILHRPHRCSRSV